MSNIIDGIINYKLIKWEKFGDHPLVLMENTVHEFNHIEAAAHGAGFINTWKIVYPGYYILELNNEVLAILSPSEKERIFGN